MTLRSLNDAKSAFASVEFSLGILFLSCDSSLINSFSFFSFLLLDYFQSYELRAPPGEVFACRMAIKVSYSPTPFFLSFDCLLFE